MTNFFEGWYFKQQSNDAVIAFIPAVHMDNNGRKSGSIQIVTPDKVWCVELQEAPVYKLKPALSVTSGRCAFSTEGLTLDIRQPDISVSGQLRFGPLTPPKGDIMGPYRFVPFMECRHSVFSMMHTVGGSLTVNGRRTDFANGAGYIEGDRGRSFPKRYIWTQCIHEEAHAAGSRSGLCSLMLSVADVQPFGIPFIGIIGCVYFEGIEHRIATYRGAKLVSAENGAVTVRQGDDVLTAQLLGSDGRSFEAGQDLRAPVSGKMARYIKENLRCRARYTFSRKERVLFDFVTEQASFEYEF